MVIRRTALAAFACAALLVTGAAPVSARASTAAPPPKQPVATGYGGAVATVDADATRVGIEVLRRGGNAVDAAVAAAATLGVTEPYSSGIGGGGYFVYYDAASRQVRTIDGRETAPAAMGSDAFLDPTSGQPLPFADAVTSGLSVGVPGTPLTWQRALDRWGTISLGQALRGAIGVAERGFAVDATFRAQTADNEARFRDIVSTRALFLPGGQLPVVGSVFRNPELARTYRLLARDGVGALYSGPLAADILDTVAHPPVDPAATRVVRPGLLRAGDLAAYRTVARAPTHVRYHGLDAYGMAPSSSGGSTVGEALNILAGFDLSGRSSTQLLHHYLEASRLAFADRNRWVGDPDQVDVPLTELLSPGFAKERSCLIDPAHALSSPVAPGDPDGQYTTGCPSAAPAAVEPEHEGLSTTHLVTADRWGNVVAYTLTIEQTGGSALTVPGRGFLLNNELTDFNFAPVHPGVPDPNLPAPGKRPRSSMSPTILLRDGRPAMAVGSPGGASIITTVLQILVNRLDAGMTLPEAVAAPRASQRDSATTQAEPTFLARPERAGLEALGHSFVSTAEIGAAAGLEFLGRGLVQAVAEPVRRGGGSAMVVNSRS